MLVTEEAKVALQGSVAKWERIVIAIKNGDVYEEDGRTDCPLCQKFNPFGRSTNCEGCPIRDDTGARGCSGTPYDMWSDEDEEDGGESEDNAQAMLDYLVGLDRRCEVAA